MTTALITPDEAVRRLADLQQIDIPEEGRRERTMMLDLPVGRRYAVLYEPLDGAPRLPFVQCHPFGFEQTTLRPLEVLTARMLASAGHPVLYLQTRGYGDSDGEFEDTRIATHLSDALAAATWLRERTGEWELGFLGLRLGALVALLAADREGAPAAILHQPVVRPKAFLTRMVRAAAYSSLGEGLDVKAALERMRSGDVYDLVGYPVYQAQLEEADRMDVVATVSQAPAHTFVAEVQERGGKDRATGALVERLRELGGEVTVEEIPAQKGGALAPAIPHGFSPTRLLPLMRRLIDPTLRWAEEHLRAEGGER